MSDRATGMAVALLALAGIAIAGYLTWVHFADVEPFCSASGECARVQSSDYAQLAGVPLPVVGLLGYSAILASLALRERTVTAFLALVGFGFSLYLTWIELFVIDAICQWCVGSALVATALAVLSSVRLLARSP